MSSACEASTEMPRRLAARNRTATTSAATAVATASPIGCRSEARKACMANPPDLEERRPLAEFDAERGEQVLEAIERASGERAGVHRRPGDDLAVVEGSLGQLPRVAAGERQRRTAF